MKSSSSIWHYVVNVKSTVKISSVFVAFLENMNFTWIDSRADTAWIMTQTRPKIIGYLCFQCNSVKILFKLSKLLPKYK